MGSPAWAVQWTQGRCCGTRGGHWEIENRLHYVRDATLAEDASQVRKGSAPQVMAALRNLVINVLPSWGESNIASALRRIGWTPGEALRILGLTNP